MPGMKTLAVCFICCGLAFAQKKPAFEVATVKPSDPNPENTILVGMSADQAIVRYGNITLRDAIRGAFRVRDFQIVAPDWMSNARFQIEGSWNRARRSIRFRKCCSRCWRTGSSWRSGARPKKCRSTRWWWAVTGQS